MKALKTIINIVTIIPTVIIIKETIPFAILLLYYH